MSSDSSSHWSPDYIADKLAARARKTLPLDALKAAAVLVPIIESEDGPLLLLTQRPPTLGVHGGQPSFPGGRVDSEDEDRWATALRETQEELGISSLHITPLGLLDDFRTVTNFHITPCVGLISPEACIRPSPAEVEEVFKVPLATFNTPSMRRTFRFGARGGDKRVYFYLTAPHIVWGATGGMIQGFVERLNEPEAN